MNPFADYCQPFMVHMRNKAGSVCIDPECNLSGRYAHAGPCEDCGCGDEHAIWECPKRQEPGPYSDMRRK
jgi:hypothetical protein